MLRNRIERVRKHPDKKGIPERIAQKGRYFKKYDGILARARQRGEQIERTIARK
jgi:hypothetical protein